MRISEQLTGALEDKFPGDQNIDLAAAKRWMEIRRKGREASAKQSTAAYEKMVKAGLKSADWTKYKGVLVLRIGNEPYIAVPVSGKKSSAKFDVVDIRKKGNDAFLTQLKKKEVGLWLASAWKREHGF